MKNKAFFISLLSGCVDGSAVVFIIFLVSLLVQILTQLSLSFVFLTLLSTMFYHVYLYQISGNLPNWNKIQPNLYRLLRRCFGSTHDRNNFTVSYKTCPPVVRRTGDH